MLKEHLREFPLYIRARSLWHSAREFPRKLVANERLRSWAWRRRALPFYRAFVREGDLCFDIGANRGSRTELFLALGARVVAVEPNPQCADELERKFRRNPSFTLVRSAVGKATGNARMFLGEHDHVSTLSPQWREAALQNKDLAWNRWDRTMDVPVTTFDVLIEKFGKPHFSKIDVEGFESEVLSGLSVPIPQLSFEYTQWKIDTAIECVERLSRFGDYEFNFSPLETMRLESERWVGAQAAKTHLDKALRGGNSFGMGDVYARHVSKTV